MLPYPWNSINILFVCSILFLVFKESGLVIWLTCAMHFFIELYSVQPFGIALVASTFSLLFTYWLYQHIFTNHSWYAVIALSIISLILYRGISLILLFIFSMFIHTIDLQLSSLMIQYAWEILSTTLVASIIYGIPYILVFKKKQPKRALFI
ncbi:hypothetical protein KKG82_02805 [Patescibacteria group bacterium]|nr:hypothetical protein [Patescibacteria group bacterium]